MLGNDCGEYATPHVEFRRKSHEAGLRGGNQIIEDLVRHCFMESAFVAVGPDIKFQTFQLDALAISDVVKIQGCKIGLPRFRAQAGKLRDLHVNQKVTLRIRIGEGFQDVFGSAWHLSGTHRSARITRCMLELPGLTGVL